MILATNSFMKIFSDDTSNIPDLYIDEENFKHYNYITANSTYVDQVNRGKILPLRKKIKEIKNHSVIF